MSDCIHCGDSYNPILFGVKLPDFEGCYDCWYKSMEDDEIGH